MNNLKDRVTIYQVAQAAGVSLATVSRVINHQGNVTEATRKKVEETIQRLGYRPSGLAQALATNKTTNIGVIIPSANYVYLSNMLNGITDVAKEKGFQITLFTTSHSKEEAINQIEKVISSHVDGAIVFDDELNQSDIEKIASYNVPSIVINSKFTSDRVGGIYFDYDKALSKAIEDRYADGYQGSMSFLHVHNCGQLLSACEKAFIKKMEELGKEYRIINADDSYTRTYQEFRDIFQNTKTGFYIAYRDSIAAAVMNAATDSGLKVPEDIEVVSLVGTKYSYIFRPQMTAFHINMSDVGKRAMYMLVDLIGQNLVDKLNHFDAELVYRGSTKPLGM
ncbi:MAG: LacI family DNA-binding transcriptional regulator [Bacillota bacterium]|nr:LacI family DNA-binding transcriptional regulator [Bacillota bacterium]